MKNKQRLLFVYNPFAGKSQIKSKLLDLIDIFVKAGYEVTAYPTQCAGDATTAIVDRSAGYDLIVCSGGDGTLDEVVFGMMETVEKLPIGYVPAGSTNDFAKSLGIPSGMIKAAKGMIDGRIFRSDIGSLNDAFFVYVAAFGVFTEVTYVTPQNIKNALGFSAYIIEAIKSLPSIKPYHVKVTWEEGQLEDDFILGMVTNSISVGGMKGITGHHITLDDGYFEVTLIKNPTNPIELNNTLIALMDRKLDSDNIISFKTSHVVFESDETISWTRDGEFGGEHTTAEITVHPQAIDFLIP